MHDYWFWFLVYQKWPLLFKQYKENKMANEVLGNDYHECKFYDSMDLWWNPLEVIFKPISTFTNDMDLQCESMEQVEDGYHIKTKIKAMTP
jgi:hypothetical protein